MVYSVIDCFLFEELWRQLTVIVHLYTSQFLKEAQGTVNA